MGIYIYGYICGRDIYGWDIFVYIWGGIFLCIYIFGVDMNIVKKRNGIL